MNAGSFLRLFKHGGRLKLGQKSGGGARNYSFCLDYPGLSLLLFYDDGSCEPHFIWVYKLKCEVLLLTMTMCHLRSLRPILLIVGRSLQV